jgi:hypothetical protein
MPVFHPIGREMTPGLWGQSEIIGGRQYFSLTSLGWYNLMIAQVALSAQMA